MNFAYSQHLGKTESVLVLTYSINQLQPSGRYEKGSPKTVRFPTPETPHAENIGCGRTRSRTDAPIAAVCPPGRPPMRSIPKEPAAPKAGVDRRLAVLRSGLTRPPEPQNGALPATPSSWCAQSVTYESWMTERPPAVDPGRGLAIALAAETRQRLRLRPPGKGLSRMGISQGAERGESNLRIVCGKTRWIPHY